MNVEHVYEITLTNTFQADSPEAAVRQFVEWARLEGLGCGWTAYRVELPGEEWIVAGDDLPE